MSFPLDAFMLPIQLVLSGRRGLVREWERDTKARIGSVEIHLENEKIVRQYVTLLINTTCNAELALNHILKIQFKVIDCTRL